jgi:hypothetical protein
MGLYKISDEELAELVRQSNTVMEVCRKITGGDVAKSTHSYWSKRIKDAGIPTAHFKRSAPKVQTPRSVTSILSDHTGASYRTHAKDLRWALQQIGRPYVCEKCGQEPWWQGEPLVLQVDHKNGNNKDDRAENLRFLCANCHSQTTTFGSKNGRSTSWMDENNALDRKKRLEVLETVDLTAPGALAALAPVLGVKRASAVSTWISRHHPDAAGVADGRREKQAQRVAEVLAALAASGIDFGSYGWVMKAAPIVGVAPQKVGSWLKREAPEFYAEKCYKRADAKKQ